MAGYRGGVDVGGCENDLAEPNSLLDNLAATSVGFVNADFDLQQQGLEPDRNLIVDIWIWRPGCLP